MSSVCSRWCHQCAQGDVINQNRMMSSIYTQWCHQGSLFLTFQNITTFLEMAPQTGRLPLPKRSDTTKALTEFKFHDCQGRNWAWRSDLPGQQLNRDGGTVTAPRLEFPAVHRFPESEPGAVSTQPQVIHQRKHSARGRGSPLAVAMTPSTVRCGLEQLQTLALPTSHVPEQEIAITKWSEKMALSPWDCGYLLSFVKSVIHKENFHFENKKYIPNAQPVFFFVLSEITALPQHISLLHFEKFPSLFNCQNSWSNIFWILWSSIGQCCHATATGVFEGSHLAQQAGWC